MSSGMLDYENWTPPTDVQPRIVCAACRDVVGQVVCGPRHFDAVMRQQVDRMMSYSEPWQQGFVDQWGRFLTREEAWKVAVAANQIIKRVGGDDASGGRLYSENLY